MTCRCSHPKALHMALVRGKPFLLNGSCCQWTSLLIASLPMAARDWFGRNRFGCKCQEYGRSPHVH